jgi:hypothetical protein
MLLPRRHDRQQPRVHYHQMAKRNRSEGRPSIGQILGYLLATLVLFAIVTLYVGGQLIGDPARMTIDRCDDTFRHGYKCYGHPSGGPSDQIPWLVVNAGPGDVGHDVNVHTNMIRGPSDTATKDGWSWSLFILFSIGVASACATIRAIVRRVRSGPTVTAEGA